MIVMSKGLGSRKQVNNSKNNTTLLSFKDMFRIPDAILSWRKKLQQSYLYAIVIRIVNENV